LETFGFKSFADRMTFDFEAGITAVIGPNGCGKSNIVDSIKWVIGEQSAKALRGDEMTDVIFNGCATRRGMALCEVTLVLDQVGGHHGLEGEEVAITRRLTATGRARTSSTASRAACATSKTCSWTPASAPRPTR